MRILNIEGDVSYFVIYGSERLERRSDFVAPISGGTGLTQMVVLVFCRNKGIQLENGSPFNSQNSMSQRVYCVLKNPRTFCGTHCTWRYNDKGRVFILKQIRLCVCFFSFVDFSQPEPPKNQTNKQTNTHTQKQDKPRVVSCHSFC